MWTEEFSSLGQLAAGVWSLENNVENVRVDVGVHMFQGTTLCDVNDVALSFQLNGLLFYIHSTTQA